MIEAANAGPNLKVLVGKGSSQAVTRTQLAVVLEHRSPTQLAAASAWSSSSLARFLVKVGQIENGPAHSGGWF